MNKTQLVSRVAARSDLDADDVAAVLDTLAEVVRDTLAGGEQVKIRNLGTFRTSAVARKTWTVPKTGQRIRLPARRTVRFRPAAVLKEAVR